MIFENLLLVSTQNPPSIVPVILISAGVLFMYFVWRFMLHNESLPRRKKKEKFNLFVWLFCLKGRKLLIIYNIVVMLVSCIVITMMIVAHIFYDNATIILIRNIILGSYWAVFNVVSMALAIRGVFSIKKKAKKTKKD